VDDAADPKAIGDSGPLDPEDGGMSTYAEAVLADHPAGWWRFGEPSGATASDAVGAHPGVYRNVTLNAAGALLDDPNTAGTFNGSNSLVRIANAHDFPGVAPFSIELWVNPTSLSGIHRLVSHRTTGGSPSGYRLALSDANVEFDRIDRGTVVGGVATAPLPGANRWTHLVATYDRTNLELFIDGTSAAKVASTGAVSATTTNLIFGSTSGEDVQFFAGALDEVALYDHALHSDRIALHARTGRSQ
jgi:hypothetical protein